MKSNAYRCKAAALALVAAGLSVQAYAGDDSMDIGYADSYRSIGGGRNYPHGNPAKDKQPWTSPVTDLSDLTPNAQCGPLADGDPFWLPSSNGAVAHEEPTNTSTRFREESAPLFQLGPPNPVF